MPRPIYLIRDDYRQLRIDPQSIHQPDAGLRVRIEDPATCTGPFLLLAPDHVADLRNALTDWLADGTCGDRAAVAILNHAQGAHPGIPDPVIRATIAARIARTTP